MWKVEERSHGMSVCDGGGRGKGVYSTLHCRFIKETEESAAQRSAGYPLMGTVGTRKAR